MLVKGPRQVGKTSLLARGLQKAREAGARVEPTQQFRHVFPYELDYRGLGKPGLLRRYAGSERPSVARFEPSTTT